MEKVVLIGAGGHAKSMIDSIERTKKYKIAGFIEKKRDRDIIYKQYRVIGSDEEASKIYHSGIRKAVMTIGHMGNAAVRKRLYEKYREIGYEFPNIIDTTAILAQDVVLEDGIFIGKRAVLNANVKIGSLAIVNTAAIIEHDCIIGENVHAAVGAVVCGNVTISKDSFIGANATIIQGICIGESAIVGAGTVVIKDIGDHEKIVGTMVKKLSKKEGTDGK